MQHAYVASSPVQLSPQWFNFRVSGVRGRPLELHLTNAGGASYPNAWHGYNACASYDLDTWFRVPTAFDAASGERARACKSLRQRVCEELSGRVFLLLIACIVARPFAMVKNCAPIP